MADPPPLLAFPSGVPYLSGGTGLYVDQPGRLPVLHLFHDYDLFWIVGGEATWTFADGLKLVAPTGSFALMPPYTPAWIRDTKPGLKLRYCHFAFRPVPPRVLGAPRDDALGPGPDARVPLVFPAREAPGVRRAYAALAALDPRKPGTPYRTERAVLALLGELAAFARRRGQRADPRARMLRPARPHDERVARLRERIDADPARAWRVAQLAADLDLSPGHLHELCRRALGRSLKRYLVEARLRLALRLLKERPGGIAPSVKDVADACGFSSQHFFSRQFKAHYQLSPLQYRNGAGLEGELQE
ncbi:MAG: AraC family transcriptional regulator [Planctomycetota bacterium]|nr:AraC family transcriptional regulator [Planctomycetota bacterium]